MSIYKHKPSGEITRYERIPLDSKTLAALEKKKILLENTPKESGYTKVESKKKATIDDKFYYLCGAKINTLRNRILDFFEPGELIKTLNIIEGLKPFCFEKKVRQSIRYLKDCGVINKVGHYYEINPKITKRGERYIKIS